MTTVLYFVASTHVFVAAIKAAAAWVVGLKRPLFGVKNPTKKIMELPFYLFVCYRGNGSLNPLLLLPSPPQDKAK